MNLLAKKIVNHQCLLVYNTCVSIFSGERGRGWGGGGAKAMRAGEL